MFLEISGIKKHFGDGESRVEVLKGIDLEIQKGEICVLLGASGSGKSTLLNIIGGIDDADSGYISINGEKTADMSEKKLTLYRRKHLGYIFQMYNLIPNLNIKENVEVGAYLSDNPLDVDDILKTLGLYEHRHKLPNQLSGGQQQRTAIGRAVVKNPDILLCDEPTGALDYATSKEILKLIEDICHILYGIIMSYHNNCVSIFFINKGDKITLCEKYDDKQYTFTVSGVVYNPGSISVFMTNNMFTDTFDYENDYFNGYFSNEKLDDIDDAYIASVIDAETLTKLSRQLDVSMGEMMNMVNIFAVVMFMILIYLLSKIVIEKNAQSISMTKILGYFNSEISRLYIMSTSIVVVICLLLSLPIEYYAMKWMFINLMMTSLSGWITFYVEPMIYIEMFIIGILTYAVIAVLQYRKIKKVPLAEALKNAE